MTRWFMYSKYICYMILKCLVSKRQKLPSIHQTIHQPNYKSTSNPLAILPSFHPSNHLSTVYPSIHQSIYSSIHLPIMEPIRPSIHPSIFLSIHPPNNATIHPSNQSMHASSPDWMGYAVQCTFISQFMKWHWKPIHCRSSIHSNLPFFLFFVTILQNTKVVWMHLAIHLTLHVTTHCAYITITTNHVFKCTPANSVLIVWSFLTQEHFNRSLGPPWTKPYPVHLPTIPSFNTRRKTCWFTEVQWLENLVIEQCQRPCLVQRLEAENLLKYMRNAHRLWPCGQFVIHEICALIGH